MHLLERILLQIEDQLLMMLIPEIELLELDIQILLLQQQVVRQSALHQVMLEHIQEEQRHQELIHLVLQEAVQVLTLEVHHLHLVQIEALATLTIVLLADQVQVLALLQEVIQEVVVAVHLHHPLLQVEAAVEVLQEDRDSI
jgi:hypothetical protein